MGIETVILATLTAVSAASQFNAAEDQAEAVVAQGKLNAEEKAKEVRFRAARQTSSFLNSGLSLSGTPSVVIGETFDTGLEDINQIVQNTNRESKRIIGQGRSEAIGTIVSSFAGASLGSFGGSSFTSQAASFAPDNALFAANRAGFGNTAFEAFELKDLRG